MGDGGRGGGRRTWPMSCDMVGLFWGGGGVRWGGVYCIGWSGEDCGEWRRVEKKPGGGRF